MLRLITPLIAILAIAATAPAFATGKSPGAYSDFVVRDAAACARACADDGLCMAWTYHSTNACELTAIVPASAPEGSSSFGLAERAPAFASTRRLASAATPLPVATTPVAATRPPAELTASTEGEDTLTLLGGPEDGDLRSRLGRSQN